MAKFKIIFDDANCINDLNETVRSFYPYAELSDDGEDIKLCQVLDGEYLKSRVEIFGKISERQDKFQETDEIFVKRYKKRYLKLALYEALSDLFQVNLPWGSLTGIRPTKLAYDLQNQGVEPISSLVNDFYVTDTRAKLVNDIMTTQKGIYSTDDNNVDLYINIPFCVSRCSYCSFVSALIDNKQKLLLPYAKALNTEIKSAFEIINKRGLNLRSIYCGGGTPTSFSKDLLKVVFDGITIPRVEFTVECGRPDTMSEEKFDYLASIGVNRVSINPQTFNQQVLDLIGRKHTVQEIYDAYELARKYPFRINMDLIADLPGDTTESFVDSVSECVRLAPDNLTVHALSIKRASKMQEESYDNRQDISTNIVSAVDTARDIIYQGGYTPYYLYRQKNTSGNLENTGYTKNGAQCIYNIDVMEETTSVISCGAGGISKRVFGESGRIERQNIVKNIEQYLVDVDQIICKKEIFFG